MEDKALKNWKDTGLLKGLDEEQSSELAIELDKTANYLLSLKEEVRENVLCSSIFPVLRRLYDGINKPNKFAFIVDGANLFVDMTEKFEKFKLDYPELVYNNRIDHEAEFVYNYCEEYIKDLKKRRII